MVLIAALLLGTVVFAQNGGKTTYILPDTTTAETGTNRYAMKIALAAAEGNGLSTDGYHAFG